MIIDDCDSWPAWAAPFLRALIRTADNGRLRPTIAAELVNVSRITPYTYAYRRPDFKSKWVEVEVFVRALEEQKLARRVNGYSASL